MFKISEDVTNHTLGFVKAMAASDSIQELVPKILARPAGVKTINGQNQLSVEEGIGKIKEKCKMSLINGQIFQWTEMKLRCIIQSYESIYM